MWCQIINLYGKDSIHDRFIKKTLEALPDLVFSTPVLEKEGQFILEHPGKSSFSAHPRFTELRKYGGVHFSFFR